MKIYRGTDGDLEPVEMECEEFGYPKRTTDGEIMYSNTHFKTELEAWNSIIKSVEAGVSLAGDTVLSCQRGLRRANERAGQAAADYSRVMKNLELAIPSSFRKHQLVIRKKGRCRD